MDIQAYKNTYKEDEAPGWLAIDEKLDGLYPNKEPDLHMGTIHRYSLGGPDPIDGVSIYKRHDPSPHLHYVSYGMSELYYNEDSAGGDFSKWGFELTFRLWMAEKGLPAIDEDFPIWPINLMQNLARYVFDSNKWFEDGHFIPANGPIKADSETAMVALLITNDPELGQIDTPHGKVSFLQLVGTTQDENDALFAKQISATDLKSALELQDRLLITNLSRSKSALKINPMIQAPDTEQAPSKISAIRNLFWRRK